MENEKKKKLILSSEYSVKVNYGSEKLENCIERMVEAKRKNIKTQICNSKRESL